MEILHKSIPYSWKCLGSRSVSKPKIRKTVRKRLQDKDMKMAITVCNNQFDNAKWCRLDATLTENMLSQCISLSLSVNCVKRLLPHHFYFFPKKFKSVCCTRLIAIRLFWTSCFLWFGACCKNARKITA